MAVPDRSNQGTCGWDSDPDNEVASHYGPQAPNLIEPPYESDYVSEGNEYYKKERASSYLVAVYLTDLQFGGPQEGGWYYVSGELVRTVKVFRNRSQAIIYCTQLNLKLKSRKFGPNVGRRSRSSVLSEGEYEASVHPNTAPSKFPKSRPHYE